MRIKSNKTVVLSFRDTSERHSQLQSIAIAAGIRISELLRLAAVDLITRTKTTGDKQ